MSTLIFCTSFSNNPLHWQQRYRKWVDYFASSLLEFDQMLMVDDGSPILPDWSDFEVLTELPTHRPSAKKVLFHFSNNLGRQSNYHHPGWFRSFGFAAQYAKAHQFTKVIHIESDAYLLSTRMFDFVNNCQTGWTCFWCPRWQFEETAIQMVCEDQFDAFERITQQDYGSVYAGKVIEKMLPYTSVRKDFVGDRYTESNGSIPVNVDYICQFPTDLKIDALVNQIKQQLSSSVPDQNSQPDIRKLLEQGLALHQQDKLAQAKMKYEEALKANPKNFDALHLLGTLAAQSGQLQLAVDLIGKAIEINPNQAAAYSNFGNALNKLNQFEAALSSYDKAINIKPDYAEAYYDSGIVLKQLKRLDEALQSYDKAISIKPDYAEAYSNRGNLLQDLQRFDEALESYDSAISIKPDYVDAYYNRGIVLKQLKRLDEALQSYDKAISIKPDYAEAYSNRGNALQALRRLDEALQSYDKAISIKPDYAEAYSNRGNALQALKRLDEALKSYDKAISIKPDYADGYWNKSLALLLCGEFDEGWTLYEWRWKNTSLGLKLPSFSQPLWLGTESLKGETILLYSEQGLGDTIQFCRYAKQVKALGARVVMEAPAALLPLLQSLEGVDELVAKGLALPAFDYHCPLGSLPLAFKTALSTIPSPEPYLRSDSAKVAQWRAKLGPKTKPRIGLVWSGNRSFKDDHNRSLRLDELTPYLPEGFEYVCLQKEIREVDQETLKQSNIQYVGDELQDFADTAALCELMDVVISTCTSVAHLSGALGRPTWVLLQYVPDWRWLLDREDSPWYGSVKLFRQEADRSWTTVLQKASSTLQSQTKASVIGAASKSQDATKFMAGLTAFQNDQSVQAKSILEDFLKDDPNHFDALHLYGIVLGELQETKKSIALLKKAIEIKANNADVHSNLGKSYKDDAQYELAIKHCDIAIRLNINHTNAYINQAISLLQLERLDEALISFDKAIGLKPNNHEVYLNKGATLQKLKNFNEALKSYDKAISIKPDYVDAHYNRGMVLQELKRLDEALKSYDNAISIKPDYAEAYSNRGNALQALKRLDEALQSYDKAISIKPNYAEAYLNCGNALQALKRLDEALQSYDKAISIKPNYAEAYSNRGLVLQEFKRLNEALQSYDKAISIEPNYATAYSNRGNALQALKRLDEALQSYDKAISIKPNYAKAYSNRGNALQTLRRLDEALQSYDKAISIKPDYAEAYFNRGNVLKQLKRLDEALQSYDKAISIKPDYADAYSNRGLVLQEFKRLNEALQSYDKVISIKPDYADGYWNKSLALLLCGEFDEGWRLYEWRWKSKLEGNKLQSFSQPLWLGVESLRGRTILLRSEQGLGDTIQFCRYAKQVKALGARVVMEAPAALLPLLQSLEGVDEWVAKGQALPAFDYHCPLMSLPLAFKTTLSTIPSPEPYLRSDSAKVAQWRAKLGPKTKPRIGLVWSGNRSFKDDHNRSLRLDELTPYLPEGFEYVCLQKELREVNQETLKQSSIQYVGDELQDFADTAALCELMDVVISTCTSVAHLSGALGRPTWVLLQYVPDWRWLLDREDSPWYASVKLYRQGDDRSWTPVLERVKGALLQEKQLAPRIGVFQLDTTH